MREKPKNASVRPQDHTGHSSGVMVASPGQNVPAGCHGQDPKRHSFSGSFHLSRQAPWKGPRLRLEDVDYLHTFRRATHQTPRYRAKAPREHDARPWRMP